MKISILNLDARWPPRAETLRACAERSSALLTALQGAHPAYAHWHRTGKSRKQAMARRLHDLSPEALLPLLAERKPPDPEEVNRFGFSLGLWNGAEVDEDAVSIHFEIGTPPEEFSHWNHVELSLPDPRSRYSITAPEEVHPMLAAFIASFEPEICAVGNLRLFLANHDLRGDRHGRPGWLTWLQGPVLPVPGLGDDASVEPFHGGALITPGRRPMSEHEPGDVARLRDAWLKLRAAGYPL